MLKSQNSYIYQSQSLSIKPNLLLIIFIHLNPSLIRHWQLSFKPIHDLSTPSVLVHISSINGMSAQIHSIKIRPHSFHSLLLDADYFPLNSTRMDGTKIVGAKSLRKVGWHHSTDLVSGNQIDSKLQKLWRYIVAWESYTTLVNLSFIIHCLSFVIHHIPKICDKFKKHHAKTTKTG